jgi:hypothetical protein
MSETQQEPYFDEAMKIRYHTVIHIGNQRFEITILPHDSFFNLTIEHENIGCVAMYNGLTKPHCSRTFQKMKPILLDYLREKQITILQETTDEWKMFHGMNYQPHCDCCGRLPEMCMHYPV